MASPRNTTYSVVRETTPGVTPATPALVNVDYYTGSDLSFTGTMRNSEAMTKDRSLVAATLTKLAGGGSLKMSARRDPINDILLEAAIGGTGLVASATGTATSGSADLSHTIEKKVKYDGGVDAYYRFVETYVSKAVISADQDNDPTVTYDFMSKNRTSSATVITGATYPVSVPGAFINTDSVVITIAGVTATFTKFELTIDQPRELAYGMGSNVAAQINASQAPRMTTLSVSLFRNSLALDALAGTTVSASVTIGSGAGNRYTFDLPACVVSIPEDSIEQGSMIASLMLTGVKDATLGSSLKITKS